MKKIKKAEINYPIFQFDSILHLPPPAQVKFVKTTKKRLIFCAKSRLINFHAEMVLPGELLSKWGFEGYIRSSILWFVRDKFSAFCDIIRNFI